MLDKACFLASNFNAKAVLKDIKKYHKNRQNLELITNLLLELIKAFDMAASKGQRIRLYGLMKGLSEWLYEEEESDLAYLNLLQVKLRKEALKPQIKAKLRQLLEKYKDEPEMRAGIHILLSEKDEAENIIMSMEEGQKKQFLDYPIYQLIKGASLPG